MICSSLNASVLILACCILVIHSLQYSDLEMLGYQNCPLKNNCQQIRNGNLSFDDRICECDKECGAYDDCCIDARRKRNRQPTREVCMQYGKLMYLGAYVIGCCPSSYNGPEEIRRQCQTGNISDPFLTAPVTDTLNRKTYMNRYCALCNDASPTSLLSWTIATSCQNSESIDFTFEDLIYRADLNSWGLNRQGRFDTCELMYNKPAYITQGVRPCRANLISSCPSDYSRLNYKRACESYTSVVTDGDVNMYKNPHCAICNDVPVNVITCFSPYLMSRRNNKPFSFALLLDVNRSDGDLVGVSSSQSCASGQKYDPFFKKCRTLVCAIPGYTMVNGRCLKG